MSIPEIKSTADQLLFTTVRVEATYPDGLGGGTAFFYTYKENEKKYPLLISNKHVVSGASNARIILIAGKDGKPDLGHEQSVGIPDFDSSWFYHPDPDVDLAVLPMGSILNQLHSSGREVFFKTIEPQMIPTGSGESDLDTIEEVTFIGYPNGMFDTKNLTPLIRRGITATPIWLDYCGQEAFLVDASVFEGSSGSPVFIFNQGTYSPRGGGITIGSRVLFVGVLSSVFAQVEEGKFEIVDIPTKKIPKVTTQQAIDLGLVFKASLVRELAAETITQLLASKA